MQHNKVLDTIPAWPFLKFQEILVCSPGPATCDTQLLQAQLPGLFGPLQTSGKFQPPSQRAKAIQRLAEHPEVDNSDLVNGIGWMFFSLVLHIVILYLFVFLLDSQVSRLIGKKIYFQKQIKAHSCPT